MIREFYWHGLITRYYHARVNLLFDMQFGSRGRENQRLDAEHHRNCEWWIAVRMGSFYRRTRQKSIGKAWSSEQEFEHFLFCHRLQWFARIHLLFLWKLVKSVAKNPLSVLSSELRARCKEIAKGSESAFLPKFYFRKRYSSFRQSNGIWRAPACAASRPWGGAGTSVNHRME